MPIRPTEPSRIKSAPAARRRPRSHVIPAQVGAQERSRGHEAREELKRFIEQRATVASLPQALREAAHPATSRGVVCIDSDGIPHETAYSLLLQQAEQWLGALRRAGLQMGDRVVLQIEEAAEFLPALWGCLLGGFVPVPAPTEGSYEKEAAGLSRLTAACRAADPGLIAASVRIAAEIAGTRDLPQRLTRSEVAGCTGDTDHADVSADSTALLLLTSGSTGMPKGVQLTHRNILAHATAEAEVCGLGPGDTTLNWLPLSHVGGLSMCHLRDVLLGCRQVHAPKELIVEQPLRWLDWLHEYGAAYTWAPNFAFALVNDALADTERRDWDLSRLRTIVNGAEPIVTRTARRFLELLAPCRLAESAMVPTWGMSETGAAAAYSERFRLDTTRDDDPFVEVGAPLPCIAFRIQDAHGVDAAEGVEGRLLVSGACVTPGYFRADALNAEAFTLDGWLRTGDLARVTSGRLTITGREKDVIIINGLNYYSHEIESAVEAVAGVLPSFAAACAVRNLESQTDELAVFFAHDAGADPDAVAASIRTEVPRRTGARVTDLVALSTDAFPKTSVGKISRSTLVQRYQAGEYAGSRIVALRQPSSAAPPQTATEATVTAVWNRVLGSSAGVGEFFAAGGTSLLAIRATAELRQRLNKPIPAHLIYTQSRLRDLAAAIDALPDATFTAPVEMEELPAFPLTPAQRRAWFIEQVAPDGGAYLQPLDIRLSGPLEVAALEEALNGLRRRHEMLRSCVLAVDGEPRLVPDGIAMLGLPVDDLSHLDSAARDNECNRIVAEVAATPFELESGPLVRWRLIRLTPDEHRLVLCAHHLVLDAHAFGMLWHDLGELYSLTTAGETPELEAARPFSQWVTASQRHTDPARQNRTMAEWRRQLEDRLEPCDMPADFARPATFRYEGAVLRQALEPAVGDQLERFCREQGVTPYIAGMAAMFAVMRRCLDRDALTIGTPLANRDMPGADTAFGYVTNTLPVSVDVPATMDFRGLVGKVHAALRFAVERQDVPLEELVAALPLPRDASRSPLFTVMFQTIELPTSSENWGGIEAEFHELHNGSAKLDVTVQLAKDSKGWSVSCEYSTALFMEASIQRLLDHYLRLLEAALCVPGASLNGLPMLADDEIGWMMDAGAGVTTGGEYPTVLDSFDRTADGQPNRPALTAEGRTWTYGDLNRRACRFAAALLAAGVRPGTHVLVSLPRNADLIAAMLGVWKVGAAWVPVEADTPPARIHEICADACPAAIIAETAGWLADAPAPVITPVTADAMPDRVMASVRVSDRGPAYAIFTSGTTGRPKGVSISQRSLAWRIHSTRAHFGFTGDDVWSCLHSAAFDLSVWEIWHPLACGARLVLAPRGLALDGDATARLVEQERVTVMHLTPSAARLLADSVPPQRMAAGSLRFVGVGGEALPGELVPALLAWGAEVWNLYGPTEATVWVSAHHITAADARDRVVSMGTPLPGSRLMVLDQQGELMPAGCVGELCLGGAGIADGYLARPEQTAERFVANRWASGDAPAYRSGDLARWRADGTLEFAGRTDDQVKLHGFRLELGEVESVLVQHPSVRACAAGIRKDSAGDDRLVAWVVSSGEALQPERLRAHLLQFLPAYMAPAVFVTVETLPLNASGKVNRKALPDAPPAEVAQIDHLPRVASDTELAIGRIWERLLGVPAVARTDDFFALGGHSLTAVRLFAAIEKQFGVKLPLATLFQAPTIEALAAAVDGGAAAGRFASLVPIQPEGSLPPFFCVHAAGAEVLFYRDLANRLGSDQPFYALQARHVGGQRAPHRSVEEMACDYLAEIRLMQPEGPYAIGGASLGGLVAFEMARQLEAAGQRTQIVALFDTFHTDYPHYRPWARGIVRKAMNTWRVIQHHGGSLAMLQPGHRRAYVRDKALRAWDELRWSVQGAVRGWKTRAYRLLRREIPAHLRPKPHYVRLAAANYRPDPYAGTITIFRAKHQPLGVYRDDTLGWRGLALGGIEIVDVPGFHAAIVAEPRVRVLAEELKRRLQPREERRTEAAVDLPEPQVARAVSARA
ncbi:MAG: amino acid adenylation domain-containing protein [Armatimonadetes bacterium]|nr:amino acid adenylation domain-containing protein [Armatimonadota bacterium]MDE2207052.1 amino acid adenylation domain-containing protein [Armatimonadota bacterium]